MMDNKTKAEHYRAMAEHCTALGFELDARTHRQTASEADPPQTEWYVGDLVLDKDGFLWERHALDWRSTNGELFGRSDADLIHDRGPLRRVHLADPAEGEVVVSIGGPDKDWLREALRWTQRSIVRDVARAAQAAGLLDD